MLGLQARSKQIEGPITEGVQTQRCRGGGTCRGKGGEKGGGDEGRGETWNSGAQSIK